MVEVEDVNIPHHCLDVTVAPGRSSSMSLFRGVAEAALFYCTHRTAVIHSIDPSKLAYLLFTGGWPVWPPTARVQRAPSERARCASTGDPHSIPPQIPPHPLGEWPRLPFTARIGRAPSERARSASKKGTWPRPLCPSLHASSDPHPSK